MDVQLLFTALIYTTVKALVIDTLDFFCVMTILYGGFKYNAVIFRYFKIFAIIIFILVFLLL